MSAKILKFRQVATTPGAVRFGEVVDGVVVKQPNAPGAVIGTLYVRKGGFNLANGDSYPAELTITLDW
jgi:hypothetical protein